MGDTADILIELCKIHGPSGFESPVAEHIQALLEPYMDETWIDVMGNVIGVRRSGAENARKLLFDAHIDEIGLIITGAQEGYLRFDRLGGLDARVLPASGVTILTDPPRYGVISVLPPHVLKKEDTEKVIKIEDLFIDIGTVQEEAAAIALGTPAVLDSGVRRFGDNCICGKAVDDRAGFAAILHAIELLKDEELDIDLYVMASVQEEVGVRGAAPGVFAIAPDFCIVVDVGHAKIPDSKPFEEKSEMGGGVVINRGPNMNPWLTERITEIALEKEIKHQINVIAGVSSGTNARVIQIAREGVATALFGIPLKYMHTRQEIASFDDIENTGRLLSETAKALTKALTIASTNASE